MPLHSLLNQEVSEDNVSRSFSRTKNYTQLSRLTQAAPKEKWATPSGDFSFSGFVMLFICVVTVCDAVVADAWAALGKAVAMKRAAS